MLKKLDIYLQGARRRGNRDDCVTYERKQDWARTCLEEPWKYAANPSESKEAAR